MKQLFMSVVIALCLSGCDKIGHINAYNNGECQAFGKAQFTRQVSGSLVTCSITFEKTK